MRTERLLSALDRPTTYEAELTRLLERSRRGGSLATLTQDGLSLPSLAAQRQRFGRAVARAIRRGEYRLRPAHERLALIDGKERVLYRSSLVDTIVIGAVARVLRDLLRPALSERVFSYLPGRSAWQAVDELARYLRAHRSARPDPRARGLFVVKRDVSAYGDSIPVGPGSPLWPLLDAALDTAGVTTAHHLRPLIGGMLRREIVTRDGHAAQLVRGVPTGSAIQPLICNLYLAPLDRALEALPDAFYLRYGDDLIVLHPDGRTATTAAAIIDEQLVALGLASKADKRVDRYFNGAGRAAPGWPAFRPATLLDHLGCRVSFAGAIGLKVAKARDLLIDLRRRSAATLRLLADQPPDERIGAACAVVNRMLDPAEPLAHRSAALLRHVVNDRAQLGELDRQIALEIAQAASGARGVKAFRRVGYRALRRRFGLASLVVARNRRRGDPREGAR